ncbi:unnamed protein product [Candida verbasci]|uniref:MICOS complex subunit n=1 Tax=Candida verbasci TaxID=1227364 RepID=A0A9W4TV11_9ASCO|nr:unnamed protein product [Candida verbasci]
MGKRTFYEDDELILNKPGIPLEETSSKLKQQESTHGDVEFVDGMVIRSTPILENYTSNFRKYLHDKFTIITAELGTQKSAIENEFNNLKSEYDQIVKEPILPNLIYILTISLSGSILVRNRNIGLRFITPLLFGGVTMNYTMPNTFNNLVSSYEKFEHENIPELSKQKQELAVYYQQFRKEFYNQQINLNESILSSIHDLRKFINDKIN